MRVVVCLIVVLHTAVAVAQPRQPRRMQLRGAAERAEMVVKDAAEELTRASEIYERDVKVLAHLRAAQKALADAMQPSAAIEKAWDHTSKAAGLVSSDPGAVGQMTLRAHAAVENARRSPGTADFDRLRSMVQDAIDPAARVAAANALELEDQILDWIKVQQMISNHLRRMSEIAGDSLRAAQ